MSGNITSMPYLKSTIRSNLEVTHIKLKLNDNVETESKCNAGNSLGFIVAEKERGSMHSFHRQLMITTLILRMLHYASGQQFIAFGENSQVGCSCHVGSLPLSLIGKLASTWVEADFGDERLGRQFGFDASCLVAAHYDLPGLSVCGAPKTPALPPIPAGLVKMPMKKRTWTSHRRLILVLLRSL